MNVKFTWKCLNYCTWSSSNFLFFLPSSSSWSALPSSCTGIMFQFCVLCAVCYSVTWVKLLHCWHIIVGETYEILQNSSNEEYIENKHSRGNNAERDKEADEIEESAYHEEDKTRKNRDLPLLHVQSFRLFQVTLEHSWGKKHLLLLKGKYANFKSGPTIYRCQKVNTMNGTMFFTIFLPINSRTTFQISIFSF
jgi:hypothetical protein